MQVLILGAAILSIGQPAHAPGSTYGPVDQQAATPPTSRLAAWEVQAEVGVRPAFGEPLNTRSDDDLVDDSEFEATLRLRGPLDRLGGLRLQLQGGVVSTPNFLDGDNAETAAYGEVQLGDTYLTFSELRRGVLRSSASRTHKNVFRPYARYRYSSVHEGFFDRYVRTDHRGTIGLRYRRIPSTIEWTPLENGVSDRPQILPGTYFEARAELNRVWSTRESEELWNPRVQFDLYSPPFWNATRFVLRGVGEVNFYDHALAPNGEERVDTRVRLFAGFNISEPVKDFLNVHDTDIQVELLGRFQARWSNDPGREHSRLYFVPSLTVTVPVM